MPPPPRAPTGATACARGLGLGRGRWRRWRRPRPDPRRSPRPRRPMGADPDRMSPEAVGEGSAGRPGSASAPPGPGAPSFPRPLLRSGRGDFPLAEPGPARRFRLVPRKARAHPGGGRGGPGGNGGGAAGPAGPPLPGNGDRTPRGGRSRSAASLPRPVRIRAVLAPAVRLRPVSGSIRAVRRAAAWRAEVRSRRPCPFGAGSPQPGRATRMGPDTTAPARRRPRAQPRPSRRRRSSWRRSRLVGRPAPRSRRGGAAKACGGALGDGAGVRSV